MAQQLDEPLDAHIPEAFIAAEPFVGARQRSRIDAAVVDAPAHGAFHESRAFESLDVLRRRGERYRERGGELADAQLALGQALEHGAARMIAERAEDNVEPSVVMFNHMVERITER